MISLSAPTHNIKGSLVLPGSKSLSNRLLILKEVLEVKTTFQNLSNAEDTLLLQKALAQIRENKDKIIDVGAAGTGMRFLTAFLAIHKGSFTITGSERMKERPIDDLVKALLQLGADIQFKEILGFPPLLIDGHSLPGGEIEIKANVSSQFISALLLISPAFKNGLNLKLKGEKVSAPYIDMTLGLLDSFNVHTRVEADCIIVSGKRQGTMPQNFIIESDWSAASYWYSVCALSPGSHLELSILNKNSLQGDAVLPELFTSLGVETVFERDKIILRQKGIPSPEFSFDFTNCPDIAQTMAVCCFGLDIVAKLTGLKTLKIKETDRILGLKQNLEKFGAIVSATNDSLHIQKAIKNQETKNVVIETQHDHRMALSFAPLVLTNPGFSIDSGSVVDKSYPAYWEHLKSLGFNVHLQP